MQQESENRQEKPDKLISEQKSQEKEQNKCETIKVLRRNKVSSYPYFTITDTFTHNKICYILTLQSYAEQIVLKYAPYEQGKQRIYSANFVIEDIPHYAPNSLKVLNLKGEGDPNNDSYLLVMFDLVIGFNSGHLLRLKHDKSKSKKIQTVGKFNKKVDHSEGFWTKMNNSIFGNQQFYKIAVEKPVRKFSVHQNKCSSQKYNYSYLIGNRLFMMTFLEEETQAESLKAFQQIQWNQIQMDTIMKSKDGNTSVINCKRNRSYLSQKVFITDWTDEVADYIYNKDNQLIIVSNQQNKILIYSISDIMKIKSVYSFELDIKKINYFQYALYERVQNFLLIMPYDSQLYVLNMSRNQIIVVSGHKSYITQSTLTKKGSIITAGCDKRIGLKNLKEVKKWNPVQIVKFQENSRAITRIFRIQINKYEEDKMDQTFFDTNFNNTNEERNNNNMFGFGNLLELFPEYDLYLLLTYDFFIKICKINA